MTDRIYALTVVLEKDMRTDDAQQIIDAISIIRGVIGVSVNISDAALYVAEERARQSFAKKLWNILYEDSPQP